MLKSFANIIELDIASPDTKLIFVPRGGVWIAPINEIVSNISKILLKLTRLCYIIYLI